MKRASHRKTNPVSFHLQEAAGVLKSTETDKRRGVPRVWGRGNGESLFSGNRVSVGKMKKFWKRVAQCKCTLQNKTVHLKMITMANFMLYAFYHN